MEDASNLRSVRIAAPDDALIRALSEQRPPKSGWRFVPLTGNPPTPDSLVILDLDDEAERRAWIKTLRTDGFAGPIVILGDDSEPESPDDEPVARPVRLATLLARIDAHGADPGGTGTHSLGPYDFLPGDRTLVRRDDGVVIRLTELERRLLACLAEASGGMIAREELLSRVWGYSAAVATHTVETHVWRLRQKIETDDPATRLLLTESGGYRLALE